MIKCLKCSFTLPDGFIPNACPKCNQPLASSASAKTLELFDATINGTLDLGSDFAPGQTRDDQIPIAKNLDTASSPIGGARSPARSDSDATIDEELLAQIGESDALGATLGPDLDQANISPGATITLGASGITLGGSGSPQTLAKGTTHATGKKHPRNGGKTAGNTAQAACGTSIDFGRSVLATISRRSLAEKAGPLSTTPDYEIVSKLGEGGMGVVYSAIQKTLDRKVAIKAIKAGKATSEESRSKFFYEAQITSDLDHPNIVPIHEMGANDDGTLFYSMKMVNGTPWENAILDKTREENIEILMKVCDAVAFAHNRNIIHRDLKPENVMLGAFGEVLVMDWGLAVNMNSTKSFGMSGTPVYMAPEMAKHELSKIGKASDIYILGGILFQIIVGKAPHKGKTVRECMSNAMQNINIDPGFEDPLLDIANHAMAMEPAARYASVVEFQEAIREHLRYAQSIALTHRAEELLTSSIRDQDYQGFSRALFSMQDAIELWPGNQAAKDGLHRTRLAYGQCALDRSDYDLCLQTLDTRMEDEAALYRLATEQKAEIVQRDKRFKLLRKVLAAVVLFAVVSLTIATLYARRQTQIAQEQKSLAVESADFAKQSAESEKAARIDEAAAKDIAIAERKLAEKSAEDEKAARKNEEEAKRLAQAERDRAVMAEKEEKRAKDQEVVARELAVASEQKAKRSEQVAVRNARLALLGNYQSELNLALNQTNQFDIARSNQLLQQILTIEKNLSAGNASNDSDNRATGLLLRNWAFRRIELLNNLDLPRVQFGSSITALQYAPKAAIGIIGTRDGQVRLVDLGNGDVTLNAGRKLKLRDPITAVAITADGDEAMIATGSQRSEYAIYRWRTNSSEPVPVRSMGKRELQRITISPDGKWIVGGINAGLWKWERNASGFETEPSVLDCHGVLASLQFVGESSSHVFGLATLPTGKSVCILADLNSNAVQIVSMPELIETRVTTAAITFDQQRVYLGLNDGSILVAKIDQATTRGVSLQQNRLVQKPIATAVLQIESEIQPKKHSTAVHGIEVHVDGTVLTHSDEPVVHVWRQEPISQRLEYASFLAGLTGNVSHVTFLNGSQNVAATDDSGNLILWSIAEQEQRRMLVQNVPSPLVAQAMSADGKRRSVDATGVLRVFGATLGSEVLQYIGHTPGANVSDIAIATSEPLVATIASLPLKPGNASLTEVCLWNTSTRTMVHRSQHAAAGECRIAFADKDRLLVIGDGTQTIVIPVGAPDQTRVEKRFGSRMVMVHPVNQSLAAWIEKSGSVRIVDSQDPSKWEDLGYRFFDLAINNRFEPIEADWSVDGKRLFLLFENGRIARLEWDGVSLANPSWSDEIPAIRSLEQKTPWQFFDFDVKANGDQADRIEVVQRTSEFKPTRIQVQFDWSRSESKLRLPSGDFTPVPTPAIEYAGETLHTIARTQQGTTIEVDRQGTLTLTSPGTAPFHLGRPPCLRASHSGDGRRWSTVHADGIVLLATETGSNQIVWHYVNHPFSVVDQSELSADGAHLAIVGRLPSGVRQLIRFDIASPISVTASKNGLVPNVQFARWHPVRNEIVLLDSNQKWHRLDLTGKMQEIESKALIGSAPDTRFVSMEWLSEPGGTSAKGSQYMAVLSRSTETSRIDFLLVDGDLPVDAEVGAGFQPILSKSVITAFASSPGENVLAVGDENGTLGIWFVAPSVDQAPRELFTLPGHRGSALVELAFSSDGSTILSSDASRKSVQWRSR